MEILLDKRSVKHIKQSALDAIQDGDTDTLRDDVMDAFSEEQIEEIERRIDSGDFYDFLGDALEEWGGDDVDELFELLESHLSDVGIELKYVATEVEEEAEEETEEDAEEDFDEADDEDAETESEFEEEEEVEPEV
jgi:hypothetical protein